MRQFDVHGASKTVRHDDELDDAGGCRRWFGTTPPDFVADGPQRGTDYIYSYLHGFYVDPTRPTGA